MSVFEEIVAISNLREAFKKAYKVERTPYSSEFALMLPFRLKELQSRLTSGEWRPHRYKEFKIYEPKERLVSKAHFEDRIVHHAYYSVMECLLEEKFSRFSAATRKNKGLFYAVNLVSEFVNKYDYFLKFDIRHYFPSIDHEKLATVLEKYSIDEKVHALERLIIDNATRGGSSKVGLPIGNLTSQFWANVYLNELDNFLLARGYEFVRYMDDTIVFGSSMQSLQNMLREVEHFVEENLLLTLKKQVTLLGSTKMRFPFIGRVFQKGKDVKLRRENKKRIEKAIGVRTYLYENGEISYTSYFQALSSYEALL